MPIGRLGMTVEGAPRITSDEGLINFANCALKMLRESPRIRQASDVSAYFLTEIAVILFGSDTVPFPHPCKTQHHEDNITAVLSRLSCEIDLKLDHINPVDVVSGDRRAVSNTLELLTAFILHCIDEDLLDFDRLNLSSRCFQDASQMECDKSGLLTCYSSYTHLSMSPELPRSMGRACLPPSTPGQTSVHPIDSIPLNRPANAFNRACIAPHSVALDRMDKSSSSKAERPVTSGTEDSSQDKQERSSSIAASRLTQMQRLHPYFSFPSDDSPPATPKGADELVEIVKHQSPPTMPPSLRCSPVFHGNVQQQMTPIGISVGPWENILPPVKTNATDETSGCETQAQNPTATTSSDRGPRVPQLTSSQSDCDTDLEDDDGLKQTAILQRSLRRKISSSSSGRGHSPTQTLTAPGASVTSMPASLSESPMLPSNSDPVSRDVACQTTEYVSTRSLRSRCKQQGCSQRTGLDRRDAYNSHTSVATTNSILAWSPDRRSRTRQGATRDRHNSSSTSILSSSLCSRPSERGHLGPCPSASVLLARTEGFSKALKRRLDYLRMIFCRAHDEAEAVSQLVQVIGSQNSETLEFMNRCLHKGKRFDPEAAGSDSPYSFKPLEEMVQRILAGIEVLLSRGSASPYQKGHSDTNQSQKHAVASSATKSLRQRVQCRRPCADQSRKKSAHQTAAFNHPHDSEFEELMELKHSLMMDTLTWLRSELKSKRCLARKPTPDTLRTTGKANIPLSQMSNPICT